MSRQCVKLSFSESPVLVILSPAGLFTLELHTNIAENAQMQRHKKAECTDAERLNFDCTEVKFNENLEDQENELFEILSEFKEIWEGHVN